jgi:hypothetical protein
LGEHTTQLKISSGNKIYPKSAEAYLWRVLLVIKEGINKGAIVDFTQVIRMNPKSAEAYLGEVMLVLLWKTNPGN